MIKTLKSCILVGCYISLGAIVFLTINDPIIASCFFALGILLVINYHNMLLTRVIPFYFAKLDYKIKDILLALLGNFMGAVIIGILISFTRLGDNFLTKLNGIVDVKLSDNILSLFIMAIFCGILVAYSSFSAYKYKNHKGAQIFYVWLFITAFVLCGFEHVVANFLYFTVYIIRTGFDIKLLLCLLIVLVGNFVGGCLVGLFEKKKLDQH